MTLTPSEIEFRAILSNITQVPQRRINQLARLCFGTTRSTETISRSCRLVQGYFARNETLDVGTLFVRLVSCADCSLCNTPALRTSTIRFTALPRRVEEPSHCLLQREAGTRHRRRRNYDKIIPTIMRRTACRQ